jgi:hypothetical protein
LDPNNYSAWKCLVLPQLHGVSGQYGMDLSVFASWLEPINTQFGKVVAFLQAVTTLVVIVWLPMCGVHLSTIRKHAWSLFGETAIFRTITRNLSFPISCTLWLLLG